MKSQTSIRSGILLDCESNRNQEWLRRRKLRLEQVRKQSNEIAKALRQKVILDEKARLDEYDKLSESKFRDWKAEKLEELENKLRNALEEYGESYRLAELEPNPEQLLEERHKMYIEKAYERGKIAKQEEKKRRKAAEEKKMVLLERKKLTRKKEDLRSALIRSVSLNKQSMNPEREVNCEKDNIPKVITNMSNPFNVFKNLNVCVKKNKKKTPQKSCKCKQKSIPSNGFKHPQTIWINLDKMQYMSAGDSCPHVKKSYSNTSENHQGERPEGMVEFYDFSSRYYSKSFREFPHLVEKIHPETEMANANDMAQIEEEKVRSESKKKTLADSISRERGQEALKREKIKRDYKNLLLKLEELNKQEKMLKAQQRNSHNVFHMTDERLSERIKARQLMMESKLERIFYEEQEKMSARNQPQRIRRSGGGDCEDLEERPSTKLSFSPSNLKYNSPASSKESSPREKEPTIEKKRKKKSTKKKGQLLMDIDNILKEGRKLRESVCKNQNSMSSSREEDEEKSEKDRRMEESEREEREPEEASVLTEDGCESFLVSSSTSYKSPPSVIKSYRLNQLLDYVESTVDDRESVREGTRSEDKPRDPPKSKKDAEESQPCPFLKFYIEKLLNMSRECVANLSVSSENVSTPNITDLEVVEDKAPEFRTTWPAEVDQEGMEEAIDNWRKILEKRTEGLSEDVTDFPRVQNGRIGAKEEKKFEEKKEDNKERKEEEEEDKEEEENEEREEEDDKEEDEEEEDDDDEEEEPISVVYNPQIKNKYEEITKKCTERISELSNMLNRVRKDKEKLLSSASSEHSHSSSNKGGAGSIEDDVVAVEQPEKTSNLEGFINRYTLGRPVEEMASTVGIADSRSMQEGRDSLESWPDVMDELLKKQILSSPFKWSEGEPEKSGTPNKHSTIDSVIGNFRKEINKIRNSTFSDSRLRHGSNESPRYLDLVSCPLGGGDGTWEEESSVESINRALTSLGLNWARSFFRKNEESKAISSSSNSEKKCLTDEEDPFL